MELLRLNGEREGLYGVTSVVRRDDGAIVVAQPEEARVAVFSATGRLLVSLERPGDGPGEFRWPVYLTPAGDSVWVLDGVIPRMTLLDPSLKMIRTEPRPVTLVLSDGRRAGMSRPYAKSRYPDGSVLATAFVDQARSLGPLLQGNTAAVRAGPDGTIRGILGSRPPPSADCLFKSPNGMRYLPACGGALDAHDPRGGYWVLATGAIDGAQAGLLSVLAVAASGDTIHRSTLRFAPRPITRSMADSIRRAAIADARSPQAKALAGEMALKPNLPALSFLAVGTDGSAWLGMWAQGAFREWRIVDRSGRERTPVQLPRDARVRFADASVVVTTEDRGDGFEDLVVYRRDR